MKPEISVVIPVYNGEAYIGEAIRSVPDIEARPDLILRLVDLLFLLVDEKPVPS